jgi:hypothetical protein
MRLAATALLLGLLLVAGGIAYHIVNGHSPPQVTVAQKAEPELPGADKRGDVAVLQPGSRSFRKEASADEAALHDRLMQKLQTAHFAFNHPTVLYLTRRAQITLTLAADDRAALETLRKQFDQTVEGTVKAGATKVSPVMTATLVGRAFKIEPAGGQARAVLLATEGPVEWTWLVEPLEPGQGKLLRLNLYASVGEPGQAAAPIRVKTFEARINVDVRVWDRVLYEAPHDPAVAGADRARGPRGLRRVPGNRVPLAPAVTRPSRRCCHAGRARQRATRYRGPGLHVCPLAWVPEIALRAIPGLQDRQLAAPARQPSLPIVVRQHAFLRVNGSPGPLPVWRQPMDIINLLIQVLSGAVGGNVAGNLSRDGGLGAPANTLAGAVGGGVGGQILQALLGLAAARTAAGGFDLAGFISQLLAGGVSGGVLTAIINMIRAASTR